jgi:1-deoxy-D-xylulose-5-phosphate synthase
VLSAAESLAALRAAPLEELVFLAAELRHEIVQTCVRNGGHLGASLGTVELAIALHRVFRSPEEPIVWDVGHQAYAHKLLTGRRERFPTLRQHGGISGFLVRDESEHDAFGAGHSSTSLSAALAFAWARRASRPSAWTVAVIGDGGMTAGVALEALNNVRSLRTGPLLIVLNDNQMSIAPNVGAIPAILGEGRAAELFELFGCDYVGPIDGHDLATLIGTLEGVRAQTPARPVVLHVLTEKGKGYMPAEERPAAYHGVSPMQAKVPGSGGASPPSYSDAFGSALCRLAERDPRVVAITAAMPDGTGLVEFARRYPDRCFDVGIAEPHAVTFAAGLAAAGWKPVVAIYSTFLQRALDAIIHDVALQRLGVVFAIDRAGWVGADGPTHHGAYDLAYLGAIPGLRIEAPACLADLDRLLGEAVDAGAPVAIRYPRGGGPDTFPVEPRDETRLLVDPAEPRRLLVGLGQYSSLALKVAELLERAGGGSSGVAAVSRVKPVPVELLAWIRRHPGTPVVTLEAGSEIGGFGAAVRAALAREGRAVETIGYPDRFAAHGTVAELERDAGLDAQTLARRLLEPGPERRK